MKNKIIARFLEFHAGAVTINCKLILPGLNIYQLAKCTLLIHFTQYNEL